MPVDPLPVPVAAPATPIAAWPPQAKRNRKPGPRSRPPNSGPSRDSLASSKTSRPPNSREPDPASDGWVSVPNSGKVPIDERPMPMRVRDAGRRGYCRITAARDSPRHAAKNASFEPESPRSRETPNLEHNGGPAAAGGGRRGRSPTEVAAGRVESVPHVVERGENFWTISRLYYSSGRYYRALWKANADTYPDIKKLEDQRRLSSLPLKTSTRPISTRPRAALRDLSRPRPLRRSRGSPEDMRPSGRTVRVVFRGRDEPFSTARTNGTSAKAFPYGARAGPTPISTCRHPTPSSAEPRLGPHRAPRRPAAR